MKKRSFTRYDTNMRATYFQEERNCGWEDCTITKFSRKGMGITFHRDVKIPVESTLHLRVFTTDENECLIVNGILKWVEKDRSTFIGGIELLEILDEPKWLQLIYFIENLKDKKVTTIKDYPSNEKIRRSSPPPQKVTLPPTSMEKIKGILNYKIKLPFPIN
jgi:hypothetical protein